MKRVLVRRPGGHDSLELVEEDSPPLKAGHVLLRVKAAGVNYADCIVRMGKYAAAKGLYPMTPGFEAAGVVSAAPAGSRWKEGDRAFGLVRFGGYASEILVREDRLWPSPADWGDEDCAAFPAVFLTAYYGLHRSARVFPGENILVHSAAGGAGAAFVQLAKIHGCRVVGVVGSEAKAAWARSCGADDVVMRSEGWAGIDRFAAGFDAIFDANGVDSLREGYRRLKPGGRLVCYGFAEILPRGKAGPDLRSLTQYWRVPKFSPLDMTGASKGVLGFNVIYHFEDDALLSEAMTKLLEWIARGKIRKAPLTAFPLERVADAHKTLESGLTQGKLVLTA